MRKIRDVLRYRYSANLSLEATARALKAKVESGVQVVERWILARLRHHRFFSIAEVDAAVARLLPALNERAFKKLPGSRKEAFEQLDRAHLRALPVTPYVIADWKYARVNIDYHIELDKHYYSVPYNLVRTEVELRIMRSMLEVFSNGVRVASHARNMHKGHYSTRPEHMPAAHQAHAGWTPAKLLAWLSCALGNAACRQGLSVAYVRTPRLFEELRIAHGDGSFAKRLSALAKTDLLILDDWGLAPLEQSSRNDLLEVLDDRVATRSTLITSQLPTEHWHDYLNDPTLADAILDRVLHAAHKISLSGESLRKQTKTITK